MAKRTKTEIEESIKQLRKFLRPGATVYCVLRHVSSSGMSRRIDFYTIRKGETLFLSSYIGNALGFAVVYELGRTLYPKGFKLGKSQYGRNGDKTGFDKDGGYALRSSWL